MGDDQAAEIQLLRRQKAKLIEILSSDADFVLQHADSRGLLSPHGYQQVKACRVPGEKVTELLDHIIQRGPEAAQGLLELLKEQALQETFPLLHFVKDLHVRSLSSGSRLVTEKQLMAAARAVGRSWREIGRLALDIPSVKLEQIEEDHSLHVERVFAMLHYWRNCQREKATAAHLHSLLSQEDFALPPERIDFLLEAD
ncbi:hypothetical protein F2P81_011570 [Scophthalmus maximus]|uniref:Death domain-containing protein CRADD-like n=1 Tax=Scophthalmus maximus TaxID=52904 RepID=A0A6A4SVZ9_SCOMX|nr:hypothetical protein F2P81_011570 [Scophthalmus maximus]